MRAAIEIGAEEGLDIQLFNRMHEIPLYNQDLDIAGHQPEPVQALHAAIANADAMLIATPEYNYGVPGVLKNAIDWASRPAQTSPLLKKPAALMGASGGMGGTIRSQLSLRQTFLVTETYVMLKPELLIPKAHERFDEHVNLKDEPTRDFMRKFLRALAGWTKHHSNSKS